MTLYAVPNDNLSDAVITSVIQRGIPHHHRTLAAKAFDNGRVVENPDLTEHLERTAMGTRSFDSNTVHVERTPASATTRQFLQSCMPSHPQSASPIPPSQSYDLKASLSATLAAKEAHRLARGRINQRRYRKKYENKVVGLERDISFLLQEIGTYDMRLSEHWSNTMNSQTPWNVVSEYYRFVGRGIRSLSGSGRCRLTPHYQFSAEVFHQFLETILVPRVISGGGIGVEAHLEEWKIISTIYPDFDMKIVRMEEGPSGEVFVTSKTTVIFSESTFRNAFPHVICNGYTNPIVEKLAGQTLEISTVAHFAWNDLVKRVAEIKFQADMMSPMLSVLGSLDVVADLFRSALLTPEGHPVVV